MRDTPDRMNGSALQRRFRRFGLVLGLLSLVLTVAIVWMAQEIAGARAETELKARATEALALQSEALSGGARESTACCRRSSPGGAR
jgi:type II secretory pathway pseudopilin PulG